MSFEIWNTKLGSRWNIGTFRTLTNGQTIGLPQDLKGQPYSKYIDKKAKVLMLKFEKNGIFQSQSGIGLGKKVKAFFDDEENIIGYLDEDAMYFASYSAGQEVFERFLKTIKVL